jgi:enoyl-CoA hydratase/carnithine racemase
VGVARAREFTLLGLPIPAAKAEAWGVVHAVADDAAAMEAQIQSWLERLVANAPVAMALTKGLLDTMHTGMRQAFASAAAHAAATEDCKEGVLAFREKRKPAYRNC